MSSEQLAQRIRQHALQMTHQAHASHIGSCLSIADILAVLYSDILRIYPTDPKAQNRDYCLLSKGHAAAIFYAVLAETGFFSTEDLQQYCQNDTQLAGHSSHHIPGVEISTGSLGHALPIACGIALSFKLDNLPNNVYVILSDGECDEGTTWEAALFAAHHCLDNLTLIIDYNKIQSFGETNHVLNLEPLSDKWSAFGWHTHLIDGHAHLPLKKALTTHHQGPKVIIANTVKGKGVPFMEHKLAWHYKSPSKEELATALKAIEK